MERYFKKPPDLLEDGDIKSYLLCIVRDKKVSQSTLKITYSALRFLYETTLSKGWVMDKIPYPKATKTLPIVFEREETQSIFEATPSLKQRVMLMVTYSAGLRARGDRPAQDYRHR